MKFAVRQTRNYPSLTLSLEKNNPDVIVDSNPIPFNSPNSNYYCQPGKCIYPTDTVNLSATDEIYFFCGSNTKVDSSDNGTAYCTIAESSAVINQITEHGAFGAEQIVTSVLEVSSQVAIIHLRHFYSHFVFVSFFGQSLRNQSSIPRTTLQRHSTEQFFSPTTPRAKLPRTTVFLIHRWLKCACRILAITH